MKWWASDEIAKGRDRITWNRRQTDKKGLALQNDPPMSLEGQ